MSDRWATRAQSLIAAIMEAMPAGATVDDRRRQLRRMSYAFHGGTSWGKKVWPRECRRYLARLEGGARSGILPHHLPDDIVFPFRATADV